MKRFLALFLASLLWCSPALAGWGPITGGGTGGLIGNGACASGGSCPGTTSIISSASAVDVPLGSFVFVAITGRSTNAGVTACTDSNGNTTTGGGNKSNPPTGQTLNWAYGITTIDAPPGTTWTCNTVTTQARGIMVGAWTGAAASPHDASGSATPTAGTGTAMAITGNALACPGGGANCELVIAAWTNHTLGAQSGQTAGFTQFGCLTTSGSNICLAYQIVSATTALSYASTNASSDVWAMALEAFTAATGGATVCKRSLGLVGC